MEMAEGVQITVPLTADAPSNSIYWDDYQYSSLPWYYRQSKSHVDLIRLRLVRIRVRTCDSQRVKDQGVTAVPELQRRCVFPKYCRYAADYRRSPRHGNRDRTHQFRR